MKNQTGREVVRMYTADYVARLVVAFILGVVTVVAYILTQYQLVPWQ